MSKAEEKAKITAAINDFCTATDAFLEVCRPHAFRQGSGKEILQLVGELAEIRFIGEAFADQLVSDLE